MNKLLPILLAVPVLALATSQAYADGTYGNCQPIYGGGQTCTAVQISINKTVLNPQTNTYVDNLGMNDPKYGANDIVKFQLNVTNAGQATITNVDVKDILPSQYVTFQSGLGNFNTTTNTLDYVIPSLNPNQTVTLSVAAKVVSTNSLPAVVCPVNQAIASNSDQTVQDNAQFCIQKSMPIYAPANTKSTPPTGPEALGLLGLIPSGITGFFLRRKTVKN